jgi:hypothetical protein
MERFLRSQNVAQSALEDALHVALEAWAIGHLSLSEEASEAMPSADQITKHRAERLENTAIEAAVLERTSTLPMTWRALADAEVRAILETR